MIVIIMDVFYLVLSLLKIPDSSKLADRLLQRLQLPELLSVFYYD